MENNVKKCPHCGGNGVINSTYSRKIDAYYVSVRCEICGAQSKAFIQKREPVTCADEACKNAMYAWNMRYTENN